MDRIYKTVKEKREAALQAVEDFKVEFYCKERNDIKISTTSIFV